MMKRMGRVMKMTMKTTILKDQEGREQLKTTTTMWMKLKPRNRRLINSLQYIHNALNGGHHQETARFPANLQTPQSSLNKNPFKHFVCILFKFYIFVNSARRSAIFNSNLWVLSGALKT